MVIWSGNRSEATIADYAVMHARGVPVFIYDTVSAGLYGLRMRVAIAARDAGREKLEELVRWGDAHSPVACTLRQALPIELVVE